MGKRAARITRATKETDIVCELVLDGSGECAVDTGYGFADHMLTLLAFWAGFDLALSCKGDIEVDAHHSLEDTALVLGQALAEALGDKAGIERIGAAKVPMDEALAEAVVDFSGRPYLVFREDCLPQMIAGEEKDLWREFFKSLAFAGKFNLHLHLAYGHNGHHLLEAGMKALGRAMRLACAVTGRGVSSTKGSLD